MEVDERLRGSLFAPWPPEFRSPVIRAASLAVRDGVLWAVADTRDGPVLAIAATREPAAALLSRLELRVAAARSGSGWRATASRTPAAVALIQRLFPWTQPTGLPSRGPVVLGSSPDLLIPGVTPILVECPVRGTDGSGRRLDDAIAAAAWTVFGFGFRGGYAAAATGITSVVDVDIALAASSSVLSVDVAALVEDEGPSPDAATRRRLSSVYVGRLFHLGFDEDGTEIVVHESRAAVELCARRYAPVIRALDAIHDHLRRASAAVDLELSWYGAPTETSAFEHLFLAAELSHRGIPVSVVAPRCTHLSLLAAHRLVAAYHGGYRIRVAVSAEDTVRDRAVARHAPSTWVVDDGSASNPRVSSPLNRTYTWRSWMTR